MHQHDLATRTGFGAGLLCSLVMAFGAIPQNALAIAVVSVGNGPPSGGGSYLNAFNTAQTLFFTTVNIVADNEVRYVEPVDLGTSGFGTNSFNLTSTAPLTSVLANVGIGNAQFIVQSAQLDLAGNFTRVNGPLNLASLQGAATTVNVQSNAASLQQALQFTNLSVGQSTVNAAFGTASSLVFSYDTTMILSGGLLSGSIAMNHASSLLQMLGSGFQLDTGAGFQAFATGSISALSGQLTGFLNSGDAFTVSFTQATPNQISVINSSVVPVPGAVWLFGSALGVMAWVRRKSEP